MNIVKLFFPGRLSTSVEPKKKVAVPKMDRIEPKPTLMAIPNFAHAEQVEYDKKEARLKLLEAYIDEYDKPSVDLALEILDVTMTDEEHDLQSTN